ncbi:hypothetical protein ISS37_09675 [candidate division KSB1 bacterium]|nr:hypothetical protein [candidate division KSB1 bacterium]
MRDQMKWILYIFTFGLILLNCGPSQSEHDKLKKENVKLKAEIEELKFGAERLYKIAENSFIDKDYNKTIEVLNNLFEKHPGSPEAEKGKILISKAEKALKKEKAAEERAERLRIQKEKQRLANATSKMRKSYDDIQGVTFYRDKTTTEHTDYFGFFLYIGKRKLSNPWLRFRIQFTSGDWLFIQSYIIKVGDKSFTIAPSYGEIKRDSGGGRTWEWYDTSVNSYIYNMIKAIISNKSAIVRYNGRNYHKDFDIDRLEITALKNVLDVYEALGGSLRF